MASIIGRSRWESAHSLFLRLIGEIPPIEDSPQMRWGRELEGRVADMFADGHEEYEVVTHGVVTHPVHDFIIASPDRLILQNGEPVSVLEIKTADIMTRDEFGEPGTDEIPVEYLCQVQHYMGMIGVDTAFVAVYFRKPGLKAFADYKEYVVNFDPKLFEVMVQKAVEFWTEHAEKRVPPPITEADTSTVQYYRSKYPTHDPGKWIESTEDLEELSSQLILARDRFNASEKEYETLKTKMIAALGDAEGVETSHGKITYKASKPSFKTDWKAVADAVSAPQEIINQFTQEIPGSRRFLLPRTQKEK